MKSDQDRALACLAPGQRCQVWLDFDGTITRQDVLDDLILRHAVDESWKAVERRWQNGEIGSRQCLSEQLALVRITPAELDALLDGITLDAGAQGLFSLLEAHGAPAVVLSDCVDFFIRRILDRHGMGSVPVRANTAVFSGNRLQLVCQHGNPGCSFGAAHCKCASMDVLGRSGRRSIYVGDGRSDLCAARKADVVFAKGVLAKCLEKESRPYIGFSTLGDVAVALHNAWGAPAVRVRADASGAYVDQRQGAARAG